MIFNFTQSKLFWMVLLYFSIILGAAFGREATGNEQLFFQIKQGARSQREAFISLRAKTALDCVFFCLEEKRSCTSLNYAEPTSVNDGEKNCELHEETKNDDGRSLEFLQDDRYTFYQIPGASHEVENTQKTENATEQVIRPSCLDHFKNGSKTSGNYTIFEEEQHPLTVYCDMESEPGSVWTLVMSFTRENKHLKAFKKRAMYQDAAKNKYSPNWSEYRMARPSMVGLKKMTTHWRITCSFPQYAGVDINTDYVRAVFADFDLLSKFSGECKNVSYISVMGQSCSECTAQWTQIRYITPHIAAMHNDSACDIKSDKSGHNYFGAYYTYNPNFRCTESSKSTTNYWFGSYV